MAKSKTQFVCQSCQASSSKWQGRCDQCGAWNTLVEEIIEQSSSRIAPKIFSEDALAKKVISLPEVKLIKANKNRLLTQIGELDRVLGGGLVPGSVVLIGGEPGIGKSTLLTQMILSMEESFGPILYVCGEESPSQISLRINRFLTNEQVLKARKKDKNSKKSMGEQLLFISTQNVDEVIAIIKKKAPKLVIVDSIQTVTTSDLTGAGGSIGQIRECTERLTQTVKSLNIPMFLVGHVTKDGNIAGPKVLEHIVDSVLELSGERTGQLRILRALKNRFGATDEVGVFKVEDFGLSEVNNPSEILLENHESQVPGNSIVCIMEGTRPLLVEVQALVVNSQLAMPRRVGRGIELSRIQVLSAVLQKHCRLPLGSTDVFLSAAGGFTIKEPAVDLGLAVAMVSSLKNKALPARTVFIGEIGLLGEIRSVSYLDRRIKEAKRLGYKNVISRKTDSTILQVLKKLQLF
jgi:DNA repair protein RadA/Sms